MSLLALVTLVLFILAIRWRQMAIGARSDMFKIIDNIPNLIVFVKDNTGKYVLVNHGTIEQMGFNPIGFRENECPWGDRDGERITKDDREVFQKGNRIGILESVQLPDRLAYCQTSKILVNLDLTNSFFGSQSQYLLGVSLEVTNLVKAREAATKAKESTEKVSNLLRHDLKSYILGIEEALYQIESRQNECFFGDDETIVWWQSIRTKMDYATILVQAVSIETERSLIVGEVTLKECMIRIQKLFVEHPEINYIIPSDDAKVNIDDSQLFGRAFYNIIENAIKYSGSSSIEIGIKSSKANEAIFWVRDKGCGMSKRQINKIMQGNIGISVRSQPDIPGSGIGLYGAKQIIEQHEGTLLIKSQANNNANNGTLVVVKIPLLK